jgi:hypothetical protein
MVPRSLTASRKRLSELLRNSPKMQCPVTGDIREMTIFSLDDDYVKHRSERGGLVSECTVSEYLTKYNPPGFHDGAQIGDWTLLYRNAGRDLTWQARCKCGTEKEVREIQLRRNKAQRCHACALAVTRGLEAKTFAAIEVGSVCGEYTVEKPHMTGKSVMERRWWCRCSCGIMASVEEDALRRGRVLRCPGCTTKLAKGKRDTSCKR